MLYKMTKIRLTKRFTFEMAHALLGYDGLCKNIHGHSYVLWVTVIGVPIVDDLNPKNGMVLDYSVLSKMIKTHIIDKYDHALLLNSNTPKNATDIFKDNFSKFILVNYQPTCENLLEDFSKIIVNLISDEVKLYSLKLQETETSFAEWFAEDNA